MVAFEYDDVHMWVGGELVRDPHLRYKGGKMHVHKGQDLDWLNEDILYE